MPAKRPGEDCLVDNPIVFDKSFQKLKTLINYANKVVALNLTPCAYKNKSSSKLNSFKVFKDACEKVIKSNSIAAQVTAAQKKPFSFDNLEGGKHYNHFI